MDVTYCTNDFVFWIFLLTLSTTKPLIGQDLIAIKEETPGIELVKSKKVSKLFNARAHTLIHDKDAKRIMVRCKLSPFDNKVDVNSFSLIDPKHKIRYRLSDIAAYYVFGGPEVKRYYDAQPFDKKGNAMTSFYAEYDPSVEDTFQNYEFTGFKVSEVKFPFSKGQRISTYFGVIEGKKKFTADMYFVVHKYFLEQKDAVFHLYFGHEKVADIIL